MQKYRITCFLVLSQGLNEMTFVNLLVIHRSESALSQRSLLRIILQQDNIIQKGLTGLE